MANEMSRLAGWLHANALYAAKILQKAPRRLVHVAPSPKPESDNSHLGRQILSGVLICAGHKFSAPEPDWFDTDASPRALARLHDFQWLSTLATAGDEANKIARALVESWLTGGSQHHNVSWAPDVLGARITAWLSHTPLLPTSAEGALKQDVMDSLWRQVVHLTRVVRTGQDGIPRLIAVQGLVFGAACLGSAAILKRSLSVLLQELSIQILEDGTHIERSPTGHLRALDVLVDIQRILDIASAPVPQELTSAVARLAPMLRFFRHGDGQLALFNGSTASAKRIIDATLARSGSKKLAPTTATHGKFQRLPGGSTLVIMDTGEPAPRGFDTDAHAGCLSFEMSEGAQRIIVNCGSTDGAFRDVLRATAAHSTLVVNDVNSAEVHPGGGLGRRPTRVEVSREQDDAAIWLTASHDGYRERFGVVHRRRLYLRATGDNLRGEDTLVTDGPSKVSPHMFSVRFHLHPDVKASLVQNGVGVLLRLPSGGGWRFQSSGGFPRLEESIYFGDGEPSRQSQQIVVEGPIQHSGAVIKWAFQKVGAAKT